MLPSQIEVVLRAGDLLAGRSRARRRRLDRACRRSWSPRGSCSRRAPRSGPRSSAPREKAARERRVVDMKSPLVNGAEGAGDGHRRERRTAGRGRASARRWRRRRSDNRTSRSRRSEWSAARSGSMAALWCGRHGRRHAPWSACRRVSVAPWARPRPPSPVEARPPARRAPPVARSAPAARVGTAIGVAGAAAPCGACATCPPPPPGRTCTPDEPRRGAATGAARRRHPAAPGWPAARTRPTRRCRAGCRPDVAAAGVAGRHALADGAGVVGDVVGHLAAGHGTDGTTAATAAAALGADACRCCRRRRATALPFESLAPVLTTEMLQHEPERRLTLHLTAVEHAIVDRIEHR